MNILGKRSDLPFSRKSDRKKEKSMVSFTHVQKIICCQTLKAKHSWTALRMSRPLFVGSYLRYPFIKISPYTNPSSPGKVSHTTEVYVPTLFELWCGFFYVPQEPDKWERCETGPMVFRPYPRRLESLTFCTCHYKGETFLKTLSVCLGGTRFEPATSRSAYRFSPNWANKAAVRQLCFIIILSS